MTYASIVLHLQPHVDAGHASEALAIGLARRFGAHLRGLATPDRSLFALALAAGMTVNAEFEAAIERTQALARQRCHHLTASARDAGLADLDLVVVDDGTVANLAAASRCSDLLVVAQPGADGAAHGWSAEQLEELLLRSVAPVLVVPPGSAGDSLDGHLLVGWNDSPEAARAVTGALPLLRNARQVTLLQWDSPFDFRRPASRQALDAPLAWLARHGVRAGARIEPTAEEPGLMLMKEAENLGADLVVMGAWGHWRWSERLLGGATRHALRTTSLPVLMSH